MPIIKSPIAIAHLKEILEKAMTAEKGIRIILKNRGEAVALRSRLNYIRAEDRKTNSEVYKNFPESKYHNASDYDKLVLTIPKKGEPEDNVLTIQKRSIDELVVEELK